MHVRKLCIVLTIFKYFLSVVFNFLLFEFFNYIGVVMVVSMLTLRVVDCGFDRRSAQAKD